jgi:alpha-galactosidase
MLSLSLRSKTKIFSPLANTLESWVKESVPGERLVESASIQRSSPVALSRVKFSNNGELPFIISGLGASLPFEQAKKANDIANNGMERLSAAKVVLWVIVLPRNKLQNALWSSAS